MTEASVSSPLHYRSSRNTPTTRLSNPSRPINQDMPPLVSPRPVATPLNNPKINKPPSPNYFGFQGDNDAYADTPRFTRKHWSPPSSTVRSTAAGSPSFLPLDQDSEFDAFRRKSEEKVFNLTVPGGDFKMAQPPSKTKQSTSSRPTAPINTTSHRSISASLDPSTAELSRSPKRVLSPGSLILPEGSRRASPATFAQADSDRKSKHNDLAGQPQFALPPKGHLGSALTKSRAETLPETRDPTNDQFMTPQRVVNVLESNTEEVLILDLRVSTQYARSHIKGAMNLCIPTTLLKRASFNVQKLAETFKDETQKQRFERWRSSKYIIVYDAASSLLKDAQICLNTIKKFQSEGYNGTLHIIKGGFADFSRLFPAYIQHGQDAARNGDSTRLAIETEGPKVAPVVGGCPIPATDKPANPFFGNIRQNMDLIGGVGLLKLNHPAKATKASEDGYPEWLRHASDSNDEGKLVSKKFEQIEQREKKRMEEALSGTVSFGTPRNQDTDKSVQIAGFEKGTKNRYNNIWPFEHSRVRLQGVPQHGCDYFNASHIKAGLSHKHYISTQAPIPATFNDFWSVVWQEDVRVIVMLTAEQEGAQVKAHNYWNKRQYGSLRLDFLSEKRASIDPARIKRHKHRPASARRTSTNQNVPLAQLDPTEVKNADQPYVTVRRFTLSHEKHPFEPMREITQLQYSSWPDFGAPADPAHLLGLVEQCDAVVRNVNKTPAGAAPEAPNKRPIIVHCSAGCGRTGTFCTVDSVIDMLKRQRISRGQRQATPMDIDRGTPSASSLSPSSPYFRQSQGRIQADRDGGFFGHNSEPQSGGSPDGPWTQHDDLDLVEKTVEDFRHQRISMVQSLRQYVLCYESIMEWLVEQSVGSGGGSS